MRLGGRLDSRKTACQPNMPLRECTPGTSFQISFERDSCTFGPKCDIGNETPGRELRRVPRMTAIMLREAGFQIRRKTDVALIWVGF
jgi:hypothetical protein